MWIVGISLARHVVKVLTLPPMLFMPIVGLLCIIGSYSLGLSVFNLYLMLPVGILAYAMTELGYPIAPWSSASSSAPWPMRTCAGR